jgi:hypothetical protein
MTDLSDPIHIRQRVRAHVVTLLAAGRPAAILPAGRVLKSRVRDFGEDELPAVIVYTLAEQSGRRDYDTLDRNVMLAVEVRAAPSDDSDDDLDRIAAAIEMLMDGDMSIGGLARDSMLSETEIGLMGGQGVVTNAVATLKYRITCQTGIGQPAGPD